MILSIAALPHADKAAPERRTQMIGALFDSPWKILIVAVVIVVLFGCLAWATFRALSGFARR